MGVGEGEAGGVKEVAVEREGGGVIFHLGAGRAGVLPGRGVGSQSVWGAVESVADDGMAQGLQVDANLVGTAGLDADLDEGEVAVVG